MDRQPQPGTHGDGEMGSWPVDTSEAMWTRSRPLGSAFPPSIPLSQALNSTVPGSKSPLFFPKGLHSAEERGVIW